MVQEGALARRTDSGDLVERIFCDIGLAARPMRPDGKPVRFVAQALDKVEDGVSDRQAERFFAWQVKNLASGVAIDALGNADQGHIVDAKLLDNRADRVQLAEAAIDQNEVGPGAEPVFITRSVGFRTDLLEQSRKPALHDFAHHAVIVARREIFVLDVELAVLVLGEPVRARHDHAADRVGPHDVAVVVNFDAARR